MSWDSPVLMLSTWPALVFILPKHLDFCYELYYNVEVVRNILMKGKQMTGLEIMGVLWIVTQVFGNDMLMICVSGCS